MRSIIFSDVLHFGTRLKSDSVKSGLYGGWPKTIKIKTVNLCMCVCGVGLSCLRKISCMSGWIIYVCAFIFGSIHCNAQS
jgi:hypothetical protein